MKRITRERKLTAEEAARSDAIRDHVSPRDHAAVVDFYQRASSPLVYPDHASAAALYQQAAELPSLDGDQRSALTLHLARYNQQHDDHSARMNDAYIGIYRTTTLGTYDTDGEMRDYWSLLAARGYEREALNRLQWILLAQVLDAEQMHQLPAWHQGNRPWDREYNAEEINRQRKAIREKLRNQTLPEDDRRALEAELRELDN
ncbi:MAG: hypothetical protein ACR2GY_00910 [Phycisphaerales bacterium]